MLDKFEALNKDMIEKDIGQLEHIMNSFTKSSCEQVSTFKLIKFLEDKKEEMLSEIVIINDFTCEVTLAITEIINLLDIPENEIKQLKRIRQKYYGLYEIIDH